MIKVRELNNNLVNWNLNGCSATNAVKSSYHLSARQMIKEIYPTMQILEEVPIHLRRNEIAYLDFYIPLLKKCVEVHGEQHYKFIAHFHINPMGFVKAQKKDREKVDWCNLNNISFVELPFDQQEKWKELIIK